MTSTNEITVKETLELFKSFFEQDFGRLEWVEAFEGGNIRGTSLITPDQPSQWVIIAPDGGWMAAYKTLDKMFDYLLANIQCEIEMWIDI